MALSLRLKWKLDRLRQQGNALFGSNKGSGRPSLCPSCGTLVGPNATKCHQCGANLTFSLAAASRSLSRLMPVTSPVTYAILTLSCLLYGVSLLATIRENGGMNPPGGGFGGLFNFGAINGQVLQRLGASLPLPYDIAQPWRFVMAIFLHGSLVHIGMNMWVLMDIGPQIEELYGSARYLFFYVVTGIAGFFLSSSAILFGFPHFSVGGSASLLGLIGVMLAITTRRGGAAMQMLRSQLIRWLIYIGVFGLLFSAVDNTAHLGGLAAGYLLGRVIADRAPATAEERQRANLLGWGAAAVVIASFVVMLLGYFRTS